MSTIFRVFLHGRVVSCLLDSFIRRASVFLSVTSGPPADGANVLRDLSSPSLHRLEQTGTENFLLHVTKRRERTGKAVFMTSFRFLRLFIFVDAIKTAGAAEVLCNSPLDVNIFGS